MPSDLLQQAATHEPCTLEAKPEARIEKLELENRAMKILVAAVTELSLARTVNEITAVVRHAARELTGADGATFVLRDDGKCFYADEDAIAPLWKGQRFPITACISGWTMLNSQIAAIEDIYADDRIPHDAYRPTFVKSLVMVPIRTESPIGAIGNYWAKPHTATPHEIEVLQALANTTSVALESLELYKDLERRVNERTLQLAQTNQELEAFSYSVSHDLRAPLRHINGFASALVEDYGGNLDEAGRGYLSRIEVAIGETSQLIDDLLRLSRLTRGEIKTTKLDLSAMVREICEGLRAGDPRRKAEFVIGENVEANGDQGLIRAAIENLLSNAWKYSGKTENTVIEFGTKSGENGKVYFVRDNGAGFDMEYAKKLFTPFQRLHRADEFPGNGIGLATVRRIVGRHGGSAWAESEIGKGATFYFTLSASQPGLPFATQPTQ